MNKPCKVGITDSILEMEKLSLNTGWVGLRDLCSFHHMVAFLLSVIHSGASVPLLMHEHKPVGLQLCLRIAPGHRNVPTPLHPCPKHSQSWYPTRLEIYLLPNLISFPQLGCELQESRGRVCLVPQPLEHV